MTKRWRHNPSRVKSRENGRPVLELVVCHKDGKIYYHDFAKQATPLKLRGRVVSVTHYTHCPYPMFMPCVGWTYDEYTKSIIGVNVTVPGSGML